VSEILRTHNLVKTYDGARVVDGVSMRMRKGEIYGFLGPNGAGKTTLMRMLTNLVKPTAGTVELFGEPLTARSYEVLKRIGALIEQPIFYEHLSAEANLRLHLDYLGYYDPAAVEEALALVGLPDTGGKPVRHFSLGMKQRLGIARAISTRPELLILDEPVNGLDPLGIHELRELFRRLRTEHGMTLLISSHLLAEVEQIADTIGVLKAGRLVEEVPMERVRSRQSAYVELVTPDAPRAAWVLDTKLGLADWKLIDDQTLRIYQPGVSPVELSRALVLNDVGIAALSTRQVTLEEHFLELVGEEHHG
jgi:ABC-2 type transport system ATP-binding protein